MDIVVCPPFTALGEVSKAILDSNIRLGAQNMSEHNFGAYTGEIAAGMLKEFSVRYVILGHSERRQYQKEAGRVDRQKGPRRACRRAQADCLRGRNAGGTRRRPDGKGLETQVRGSLAGLTGEQMEETILAYEPVWAIGTGKTATIGAGAGSPRCSSASCWRTMFDETVARRVRIQYGGSVKPSNARELMEPAGRGRRAGGRSITGRAQFF